MKHGPSGWGRHLNLDLQWTYRDHGAEPEPWTAGRAFVWERKNQNRLLATVYVRNNDYSIYTTGLGGLTNDQYLGLNEYLESLGFTRRHKYDGI